MYTEISKYSNSIGQRNTFNKKLINVTWYWSCFHYCLLRQKWKMYNDIGHDLDSKVSTSVLYLTSKETGTPGWGLALSCSQRDFRTVVTCSQWIWWLLRMLSQRRQLRTLSLQLPDSQAASPNCFTACCQGSLSLTRV